MVGFAGGAVPRAQAQQVSMTLDQARAIAQRAYRTRNYMLARDMALILLEVDPKDPTALVVLAAVEPLLGRPQAGQKAGRQAWKLTRDGVLRHEAAFFTARAQAFDQNWGRAKLWLRRAHMSAKTPAQRAAVADGFRKLRASSPFQTQLSFSVSPSSNLNGGSSARFLVIDDFFAVGQLSGAAQALSGSVAVIDASATHLLGGGAHHRTSLRLRGYHDFNALSAQAQALAPGTRGSDFNFAMAEIGVLHQRRKSRAPLPDSLSFSVGHSWYGGEKLEKFATLELGKDFDLPGGVAARLSTTFDRRWSMRGASHVDGRRAALQMVKRFTNDNTLNLSLGLRETNSRSVFRDYSGWDASIGMALGKPIGPVQLSGSLGVSVRDYQRWALGFFAIPGGRQDQKATAEISMLFHDVDYFGFNPVVRLQGAQSWSNISRYETRSYGVSLGFRSSF